MYLSKRFSGLQKSSLAVALWTLWRRLETRKRIELWILLVNIVLFRGLLQPSSPEAIFLPAGKVWA